jgi:SAM-dependent methyltransferase
VEVGAGIGSVSKQLLGFPISKLIAFEPSRNLFPILAEKLRHEARAETINDFFSPRYISEGVDAIVYLNVLEHVRDDRAELANAWAALRPGGHLLVFAPALAWLYSDFDKHVGHFRRYTKGGLRTLAIDAGFDIVKLQYFDIVGVAPWYLSFVLLKGRPGLRGVGLYDRLVVPPMQWVERIVPPPIGKNVLLVARKPTGGAT